MTRDEYAALASTWDALMYEQNCGEHSREDFQKIHAQLIDIERQMEAAPWQFDEDGNVVTSNSVLSDRVAK